MLITVIFFFHNCSYAPVHHLLKLVLSCFYLSFHSSVLSFFSFLCPVITFLLLSSLLCLSFLLTSSLFCKLATLVRHRTSLFGKDSVEITLIQILICSICSLAWCFLALPFSYPWMCLLDDQVGVCVFTGSEASTVASCLHVLAQALDAR